MPVNSGIGTWYWLPVLAAIFGSGVSWAFADDAASGLRVCVANYHQGYFDQEFEDGPVTIPAGAVFEFNGYIMAGDLQDPEDEAHKDKASAGVTWSGVTDGEQMRRTERMDRSVREKAGQGATWSAVATTTPVTVTKALPCTTAPVIIVVSKNNHWTATALFGDRTRYYNLIGSIKNGALDRSAWTEHDQRGHAEYYATLHGAVLATLVLDNGTTAGGAGQKGYFDGLH